MAHRSLFAWALVILLLAILFWNRRPSYANVRQPPSPGVSFYYLNPGEACAEGYDGPTGTALRCQKK